MATTYCSQNDYKYLRVPHLLKGRKTWGFINFHPPSAHCVCVCVTEADLLVRLGVGSHPQTED